MVELEAAREGDLLPVEWHRSLAILIADMRQPSKGVFEGRGPAGSYFLGIVATRPGAL